MPKGTGLAKVLAAKLESVAVLLLLPLFFAYSGIRTRRRGGWGRLRAYRAIAARTTSRKPGASGREGPGNATDVRGNRFWPTRADRLRELEVGLVQGQVPKAAWVSCRGTLDECARPWRDKSPVAVTVELHRPSYRGEAVITESEPVPWARRRSYSKVHLPMRIVRVNIECRQRTRPT